MVEFASSLGGRLFLLLFRLFFLCFFFLFLCFFFLLGELQGGDGGRINQTLACKRVVGRRQMLSRWGEIHCALVALVAEPTTDVEVVADGGR